MKTKKITKSKKNIFIWAVFCLLILLHLILADTFISFSSLDDKEYLTTTDYSYRMYNIETNRELCSKGIISGFDPFLLSNPGLGLMEQDNLVPKAISLILPFIPASSFYAGYALTLYILGPFLIYISCRNFGFNKLTCLVSFAMGVLAERFLIYRDYFYGSNDFVFAVHLALLAMSFFYVFYLNRERKNIFFAILCSLLSVLLYPLSFVVLVPTGIFLYYKRKRFIRIFLYFFKNNYIIILPIVIVLIIVLIHYFFNYIYIPMTNFKAPDYFPGIFSMLSIFELFIPTFYIILAAFGLFFLRKSKKKVMYFFIWSLLFYFVGGFFLSASPIFLHMRFYRLSRVFLFFLIIPASFGVYKLFLQNGKRSLRFLGLSVILVFIIGHYVLAPHNVFVEVNWRLGQDVTSELPADTKDLIDWININTNTEGRILVEDSGDLSGFFYGNGVITPVLFKKTGKMYASGSFPYHLTNRKRDSYPPNFAEGNLFDHSIETLSENTTYDICQLYNIKWIIVWSEVSKQAFEKWSDKFDLLKTVGRYEIYEVKVNGSYFIKGNGNIEFDYGQIHISNATEPVTVISQLYISDLTTVPELRIERYGPRDYIVPMGFVKVRNGDVNEFTIRSKKW